jgi:hypothetical protein
VDEITNKLESISFTITPLSVGDAQERLDPLLRLLARSEWNELVNLTREFMYLYRLYSDSILYVFVYTTTDC